MAALITATIRAASGRGPTLSGTPIYDSPPADVSTGTHDQRSGRRQGFNRLPRAHPTSQSSKAKNSGENRQKSYEGKHFEIYRIGKITQAGKTLKGPTEEERKFNTRKEEQKEERRRSADVREAASSSDKSFIDQLIGSR